MHIDYPFHFDGLGSTAATSDEGYIRDLIEQILLTAQGERVNRPEFGCGLSRRLFEPNSAESAAAVQITIQSSLQQMLGELIDVEGLEVSADEAVLTVNLQFSLRINGERREMTVQRGIET